MKIIRKEARREKFYINRDYTRYLIWSTFVFFCNNHFGSEYLNDHDKFIEIGKIYTEYLTLKKLNLRWGN